MNGAFFVAHLAPSMESAAAGAGGYRRLAVAQESAVWIPRRLLWPAAKAPSIPLGERAVDTYSRLARQPWCCSVPRPLRVPAPPAARGPGDRPPPSPPSCHAARNRSARKWVRHAGEVNRAGDWGRRQRYAREFWALRMASSHGSLKLKSEITGIAWR
jgi:hypothetical protein